MSIHIWRAATTVVIAGLTHGAFPVQAMAQTPATPDHTASVARLEVTPFSAIGDDLAPGGGVALTYALHPRLRLEGEASLGTDAARSSLSLLYALPRWGCCSVYIAGGLGVQRDQDPAFHDPELGRTRKKTEAAINIGAGFSVPIVERFGYRFDFRWYNPDDSWPESWRIYNGLAFDWRR